MKILICLLGSFAISHWIAAQSFCQDQEESPTAAKIELQARDEVKIAANYYAPSDLKTKRPALILLHGSNRTKERWNEIGFLKKLKTENYHVVAIDIRGRGESETGDIEELRRNPGLGVYDIEAALDWIKQQPGVDHDNIGLVGSSYGANLVVAGCLTQEWQIKTVVCFSATAASYRMKEAFEGDYKIPSGFYVCGRQEPERYAVVETAAKLIKDTEGSSLVQIHNDPAHALSILHHHPETQELIVQWLRDRFAK